MNGTTKRNAFLSRIGNDKKLENTNIKFFMTKKKNSLSKTRRSVRMVGL